MAPILRIGPSTYWTAVGHEASVRAGEEEVRAGAAARGFIVEEVVIEDFIPLPEVLGDE